MGQIAAFDCDGVLIDIMPHWYEWLVVRYDLKDALSADGVKPYDLTNLFVIPEEDDPLAFWKSNTLYSGMKPAKDSVETLSKLKDDNYEVIVVSRVTGQHAASKCDWIKRWFPFADGILLTGRNEKEKSYARCHYIVEDNLAQLNRFGDNVTKIWLKTDYPQHGVENLCGAIEVSNWDEIYSKIIGEK
jgi:5'(3')-deoxyribonucleotidase